MVTFLLHCVALDSPAVSTHPCCLPNGEELVSFCLVMYWAVLHSLDGDNLGPSWQQTGP